MRKKVAIIGGGLTGLATAFYLTKQGCPVSLYERAGRTGGVIRTFTEQGYTFEAAANTGIRSHPEVAELFQLLDGKCKADLANKDAQHRWIWKGKKWHRLPHGLFSGMATPLFSVKDKFRLFREPFIPTGTNPNETLAELVRRRLGESFLDYAVAPFISGVYAGDADTLVPRYALPKLYDLEQTYGSFIKGAMKKKRDPRADRKVFSAHGGLQQLTDALAASLPEQTIHLNCDRLEVKYMRGEYALSHSNGFCGVFSHVISTVGTYALRKTFPFFPEKELSLISKLSYAPVIQVALGYADWDGLPLRGFGGLLPPREDREMLGVLCPSNFLHGRTTEGKLLLAAFLGGVKKWKQIFLTQQEIERLVLSEMEHLFRVKKRPELVRIFRYGRAIPQYERGYHAVIGAIHILENQFPNLYLAGNIRDGIGIADRIKQAKGLAAIITENPSNNS